MKCSGSGGIQNRDSSRSMSAIACGSAAACASIYRCNSSRSSAVASGGRTSNRASRPRSCSLGKLSERRPRALHRAVHRRDGHVERRRRLGRGPLHARRAGSAPPAAAAAAAGSPRGTPARSSPSPRPPRRAAVLGGGDGLRERIGKRLEPARSRRNRAGRARSRPAPASAAACAAGPGRRSSRSCTARTGTMTGPRTSPAAATRAAWSPGRGPPPRRSCPASGSSAPAAHGGAAP